MRGLIVCLTLLCAACARSDEVDAYIGALVRDHGFERPALEALFDQLAVRDDVIEKISRPAEQVWTWARYRKHLVDEARIAAGVEFWRTHRAALQQARARYGVPESIVLAILGVETRYGQVRGQYRVAESLYTLGFHYPPRAAFFRRELTEFLLLAREEAKNPLDLVGSYAGAMGYGQFIPSSYREYAVDFDGDGVRDIWDNPVDAIGSIANYFKRHRWAGTEPVALEVTLAPDARLVFGDRLDLDATVGSLRSRGMSLPPGVTLSDASSAKLFRVEGDDGPEVWLALHDFYVITRYNRSHLYALAVHHLSQAIAARMVDATP